MNWFTRFCRDLGLMVHNIRHPDRPAGAPGGPHKQVVKKSVQEKQINQTTTLRRTVIDEVEVKREAKD